jgi:hypothetical protein
VAEQKVILPAEKPKDKKSEPVVAETAPVEATPTPTPADAKAEKPEKIKKNGLIRPTGALTGKVWDIADALTAAKGRPALRKEVWTKYQEEVGERAQESTSYTQYSKWVKYNGFNEQIKNIRTGAPEANPAPAAA